MLVPCRRLREVKIVSKLILISKVLLLIIIHVELCFGATALGRSCLVGNCTIRFSCDLEGQVLGAWRRIHWLRGEFCLKVTQVKWALDLRNVGRGTLTCKHFLPVDLREERMCHDLIRVLQSLTRILLKQLLKQIPRHCIVMLGKLQLLCPYVIEEHLLVCMVEGRKSRKHFVKDDTVAPPVTRKAVLSLAFQDLGCEVLWCAYQTLSLLTARHFLLRQSEVGQYGVAFRIDQNVLRLKAAIKSKQTDGR